MDSHIAIGNIPEISEIYFALLQCDYEYFAFEKAPELVNSIESMRSIQADFDTSFFKKVKQNTCDVYPYWPRAAALESASFFFDPATAQYKYFDKYQNYIMTASNISDVERNQDFWDWIQYFPAALSCVLNSNSFKSYLTWETKWTNAQNLVWQKEISHIQKVLDVCMKNHDSPI